MLAGVAIIILAAIIAYLPSINGGFILDDDLLLTENNLIKASDGLYRFWCTPDAPDYWPVTNTTLLDRVAAVGDESDRIPCHQPDIAHCRIAADLDHFAEVVHSRGIFGGPDLRRASGKRGIGGLDRAAEKHDGDVVFPVVDSVVFKIFVAQLDDDAAK